MSRPSRTASDSQKLKAIEALVKHGRRGSEWNESGLLRAVEKVIDGDADISSQGLKKLMAEAARW